MKLQTETEQQVLVTITQVYHHHQRRPWITAGVSVKLSTPDYITQDFNNQVCLTNQLFGSASVIFIFQSQYGILAS